MSDQEALDLLERVLVDSANMPLPEPPPALSMTMQVVWERGLEENRRLREALYLATQWGKELRRIKNEDRQA